MPYWKVTFDDVRVVKANDIYEANQKAYAMEDICYEVDALDDDDPLAVEAAEEDGIVDAIMADAKVSLEAIQRAEALMQADVHHRVPKGFVAMTNGKLTWLRQATAEELADQP